MQLREFNKKDGYACWLNKAEQELLREYYSDDLEKQLAIDLLLDGLRGDDLVQNVSKEAIRQLDSDKEAYVLRIRESKSGWREAPVSVDTRNKVLMLVNAKGLNQDELAFDYNVRTIQRWVTRAATDLAEETGDEDWNYVSAHDLRRTWATTTYYRLGGTERDLRAVMSWGGWSKRDTFEDHYLGVIPEDLLSEMMEEAELR
jgi:integrase